MKLSTLVELAGWACLVRMGFLFAPEAGWGTAGAACLIVGNVTDDHAVHAAWMLVKRYHDARKSKRSVKRSAKKG